MFLLACSMAVIFFLFWRNSKRSGDAAMSHLELVAAEPWLVDAGFLIDTIKFATYNGRPYSLLPDSAVVVGSGSTVTGEDAGFVVEVSRKMGCMPGKIIRPYGLASHHKQVSLQSLQRQLPMSSIFESMMREHNKRQSDSAETVTNEQAKQAVSRFVKSVEIAVAQGVEIQSRPDVKVTQENHGSGHEKSDQTRIAELRKMIDSAAKQNSH